MPNQRIDRNWYSRYRTHMMAVVAFIVVAVIGTTFFKGCSAIGRDSRQDVYTPSADDGFIYKANQLLSEIVEEAKKANSHKPLTLQQLNEKYGALHFELPYNYVEAAGGRASDIRLVSINPDSIRSSSLRKFYYNSDLPALLLKQKQNLGERIFNIKFEKADYDGAIALFQKSIDNAGSVALVRSAAIHGLASAKMEKGDYSAAAKLLEDFVKEFGKRTGDKEDRFQKEEPQDETPIVPDAMWKLVLLHNELGSKNKAKSVAERIVEVYGDTQPYADRAKKFLASF